MSPSPAIFQGWGGRAAVLFFLAGPVPGPAQWDSPSADSGRFRLRLYEAALVMNLDAQQEQRGLQGEITRRKHLFAEQSLNLDLRGSVYHPNLLLFRLQPQLGLSFQQVRLNPGGGNHESTRVLQRYHADAQLLKEKPFATSVYADRDLTYRDFDFFNRARVDSLRYGGSTGYNALPLPVTVSYLHLEQTVTGGRIRDLQDEEDSLPLDASHQRSTTGLTRFSYQLNRFDRREPGISLSAGTTHNASLADTASWGEDHQILLQSNATYTATKDHRPDGVDENFTWNENLALQHAHHLGSNLHYNFNQRSYGQVSDRGQNGGVSLTHQLYDSLASRLQISGVAQNLHSPASTLDTRHAGTSLTETYTKRLGKWGQLSLVGELRLDREQRKSTGQFIQVADEAHTLTDGSATFLRQPNVRNVTSVTDARGRRYTETLDYLVVPQGTLLEIRRMPGGLIPEGGAVLVTYTADSPPSGSFTAYGRALQVRITLFDELLAVYGRLNQIDHTGAKFLVLQNVSDRVAGAELKWGWLQAGAEHQDFQSNFSPFRAQRLYETFTYERSPGSRLSVEFNQTWIQFPSLARNRRNYSVIARYRTQIFSFLQYSLEGGLRREAGHDFDQQLTTLRSQLVFDYGQLTVNLGYEYEKESYFLDRHLKHYLYLHAKRRF